MSVNNEIGQGASGESISVSILLRDYLNAPGFYPALLKLWQEDTFVWNPLRLNSSEYTNFLASMWEEPKKWQRLLKILEEMSREKLSRIERDGTNAHHFWVRRERLDPEILAEIRGNIDSIVYNW